MKFNRYEVSFGNPEGTDWTISFMHTIKMSQEQFDQVVEEAFLEVHDIAKAEWEEQAKKTYTEEERKCAGLSAQGYINDRKIFYKIMLSKGFINMPEDKRPMSYDIEPYWGIECITNQKLRKLLERDDDE